MATDNRNITDKEMKRKAAADVPTHRPNSRHAAAAVLAVCPYDDCGEALPSTRHVNRCKVLHELRLQSEKAERARRLADATRALVGVSSAADQMIAGLAPQASAGSLASVDEVALRAWVSSMSSQVTTVPLFTPTVAFAPHSEQDMLYLNRQLGGSSDVCTHSPPAWTGVVDHGVGVDVPFDFEGWSRAQRTGFAALSQKPVPLSALASSHPGIHVSLALPPR